LRNLETSYDNIETSDHHHELIQVQEKVEEEQVRKKVEEQVQEKAEEEQVREKAEEGHGVPDCSRLSPSSS